MLTVARLLFGLQLLAAVLLLRLPGVSRQRAARLPRSLFIVVLAAPGVATLAGAAAPRPPELFDLLGLLIGALLVWRSWPSERGATRSRPSAIWRGLAASAVVPPPSGAEPDGDGDLAPPRDPAPLALPRLGLTRHLGITLLLVDDDAGVLQLTARVLETAGCRVVTAAGGREAIARFGETPERFSAAVLDLTMPDVGGAQVYQELVRRAPRLPVIVMSGYSEEDAARACGVHRLVGFVQKPFLPDELLAEVGRVTMVGRRAPAGSLGQGAR